MSYYTNQIIRYSVLPGFLPRIKGFFATGFSFFAATLAVVYANAKILPYNHAYLQPGNYGKFGVRHVLAEAGRNVKFSRDHIDQVMIYLLTILGMVMLIMQVVLLFVSLLGLPVFSAHATTMFTSTPGGPQQDIAFIVLDNIFGMMKLSGEAGGLSFFESCAGNTSVSCTNLQGENIPTQSSFPLPMHIAMQSLMYFYAMGIWYVSVIVILYFVITIVGETVTSGTPFGQRFSKAWVVPRFIVFFALITPVSTTGNNAGIGAGQLITLSIAKYGSNFATNAWYEFTDAGTEALSQGKEMVAITEVPSFGEFSKFLHIMHMCRFAEKIMFNKDIALYFVRPSSSKTQTVINHFGESQPYNKMGPSYWSSSERSSDVIPYLRSGTTRRMSEVLAWSRYGDVILRFGHYNPPDAGGALASGTVVSSLLSVGNPPGAYDKEMGYVEPTCGELIFRPQSTDNFVIEDAVASSTSGSDLDNYGIQDLYMTLIASLAMGANLGDQPIAYCMVNAILPYGLNPDCVDQDFVSTIDEFTQNTNWITVGAMENINTFINGYIKEQVTGEHVAISSGAPTYSYASDLDIQRGLAKDLADDNTLQDTNLLINDEILKRGWVGASLWYNQVATVNGKIIGAINNIPIVSKYPKVMEQISYAHQTHDTNFSHADRFNPKLENGELANLSRAGEQYMAAAYYSSYRAWTKSGVNQSVYNQPEGNLVTDMIKMSVGMTGLVDVMKNQTTHPLAMLSGLGKMMVDMSINGFLVGIGGQTIEQLFSDSGFVSKFADAVSGFSFKFAMIGMTLGFSLYYVLPLLPFVYFFFAFSGWVKSIFEALLAMPLWALAHIRIDGQGLPGNMATNGYFLLFEIFLRPVLILSGYVGSIILFSALVSGLNEIFSIVVTSVSGQNLVDITFWEKMVDSGTGRFPELDGITRGLDTLRQPIDQFFYTVLYIIMVYMIGMSCFKMIDMVPQSILRWMGNTVSTFQERSGDTGGRLASTMYRSAKMTNIQMESMLARMKGGKDTNQLGEGAVLTGGL